MQTHKIRLLIAPDSFKGALNASGVAHALGRGVARAVGDRIQVTIIPMADGGEGTSDVALQWGGVKEPGATVNIYGYPQNDGYWVRWGSRAIVEAAVGSGYVAEDLRKAPGHRTTSLGTGLLVNAAMAHPDIEEVWVALGGTGSTDGGIGFLVGIGARLQDAIGREVEPFGHRLNQVAAYHVPPLQKPLIGLYDVALPLLGDRGAVSLFGPQKGIGGEYLGEMERGMEHWANVVHAETTMPLALEPGTGAAGGIGFGILVAGGSLRPGAKTVATWQGLEATIEAHDWVVTGEGRIDAQTEAGKAVALVIQSAAAAHKPVIAVVGSRDQDLRFLHESGLCLVLPVVTGPMSHHDAITRASELLETAGEEIGWLISRMMPR